MSTSRARIAGPNLVPSTHFSRESLRGSHRRISPSSGPTNENNFGPFKPERLPAAVEKFYFRLIEFSEEANVIHRKLQEEVRAALGEQRGEFFWQSALIHLESEMF